jgi:membrane fusion protein (multidrug efflux system)
MIKRFTIAIAGFASVVAVLVAVKGAQLQEMMSANHAPPMTTISTAKVEAQEWFPIIKAIGTLAPIQGVTLSSELEGAIVNIPAANGVSVMKGDLLIELDTSVERAQLAAAEARTELSRLQVNRAEELRKKETISQSDLDTAVAQYAQSQAELAALQANIDKKAIRAPFDGRVGIRLVNLGQFVSRGTPLIPLQKLDFMFVDFFVPQREIPHLGIGQDVNVTVDAFPNQIFTATVSAVNPQVDALTRNVAVQATLPNPGEKLRSGMFSQVEVMLPTPQKVVSVPATAISYASYGNSVFVVEMVQGPDGSEYLGVRQQPIKLGRARGDQVAVIEGLTGDEEVVSSGVFKLRNNMPVQVNNTVTPTNAKDPTPANT